ncbi:Athe_2463 domain-containing protein [Brevibacillus laterosporus]|uniref:Athe_2463 domain-containing protein n=1 Tax=Brevibacillus laterosporus TaxID=1465 RepID=UPI0035A70666
MRKKILSIIFVMCLIGTSFPIVLITDQVQGAYFDYFGKLNLDVKKIIAENNIPIQSSGKLKLSLNYEILRTWGLVVYGEPHGPFSPHKKGQQRFLGYTDKEMPYDNPLYPPDIDATNNLDKTWVKNPWEHLTVQAKWKTVNQGYNYHKDTDEWLGNRLISPYTYLGRPWKWLNDFNSLPKNSWGSKTGKWDVNILKQYGVVKVKPTKFGWGSFEMYNTDGKWYQSFLIMPDVVFGPEELDLYTSYIEGGQFEPNVSKTTKVTVGLSDNSKEERLDNVEVVLYARGNVVGRKFINLTRGKKNEQTLSFPWITSSNQPVTLKAEINPAPRKHKEYWARDPYANNVKTITLESSIPPIEEGTPCFPAYPTGYSKGISGKYYYPCPPINGDNFSICVGYYYEEMWADFDKPKPDRIKAGQGTEVTIRTEYHNDNPDHKGKPYGAQKVVFTGPNTEKYPSVIQESVGMLPNKQIGHWKTNWKLPFSIFDGEGNWIRSNTLPSIDTKQNRYGGLQRWYSGFDVPDGKELEMNALVTGGYKNTLHICVNQKAVVEGTPYNDFVVRVVDPNNPFPTGEAGKNWVGYDELGNFFDYTYLITNLKKWYEEPEKRYQKFN